MTETSSQSPRPAQDLLLDLIRHASFNELDGDRVAADLAAHRELWTAAVLHQPDVGVTLTGLSSYLGSFDADTLYVLSSGRDDARLERLAQDWRASSIEWDEGIAGGRVLCLWWD